eukprot:TRINITY_DN1854_c0_g2_i1.p1 TRINITY_DN1854_c0_g2~~TRINITY_DN1854_c0_g2_i1.p1  ORF type:complete len:546 (+),score=150.96 TRINITY_DN1854_c0_g2_i1:33-1640(+)
MNKVIGLCVGVVTTLSLGYFFSKSSNIHSNLRKVQKKFCPFEQININKEKHILLGRNITEFPTTSQLILSPHLSSSTPKSLKANTITESAFKYLEREREFFENIANNTNKNNSNYNEHQFDFDNYDYQIERISSEEFDLDSLVAIFVLTDPTYSLKNKKLLIEIANFSKYENIMSSSGHDVARIVFTLRSLYEQFLSKMDISTSITINGNNNPINRSNNTLNKIKTKESLPVFKIYESMREEFNLVVEDILKNLGKKYFKHYQHSDLLYQNSLLLLRKQIVKVEAFPCLDLNLFHFSLPSNDENQNINKVYQDNKNEDNNQEEIKENDKDLNENDKNNIIMDNKIEISNEMRNSDTMNKIMKNNQHNLSHILSHNYHNFHLSSIHSSTLPLYSSVFLYGEGDYEMIFRAESSWDYFCEINSRKPHSRPNVSSLLLSLNQLETKLGGKGVWIYENCKDHFVHSSRIFLSDPSTDVQQKESIFSALSKDQFKTECVNFLKHQHFPNSPPSKLKSSQLKSSLKSYNSTTEKIQKKVVV